MFALFYIFYFLKLSMVSGNLYVYLSLKTEMIDRSTRYSLFSVFSIIAGIGLAIFILIIWRSYLERPRDTLIKIYVQKRSSLVHIGQTLKTMGRLLKTRNMLFLLVLFAYLGKCLYNIRSFFTHQHISGLSSTFFGIVYGTCIGHYKKYGGENSSFSFD